MTKQEKNKKFAEVLNDPGALRKAFIAAMVEFREFQKECGWLRQQVPPGTFTPEEISAMVTEQRKKRRNNDNPKLSSVQKQTIESNEPEPISQR